MVSNKLKWIYALYSLTPEFKVVSLASRLGPADFEVLRPNIASIALLKDTQVESLFRMGLGLPWSGTSGSETSASLSVMPTAVHTQTLNFHTAEV